MSGFVRQTLHGFPLRGPFRSQGTFEAFAPIAGWTPVPDIGAPIGSMVSGQNVVIEDSRLKPRLRLEQLGTNRPIAVTPVGAFLYYDVNGTRYPVVVSSNTVAYFNVATDSWTTLNYASGASNNPPSGGVGDNIFGTSVYLERRDLNVAVFANGVDPLFVWGGPSDNTAFSTLTQSPIAKDVTLFDNSAVAWNIRQLSSTSRFVTRVQWCVGGDPEDWTGIGSGFEDLVDFRGEGTRILPTEDALVLASTKEIWYGRKRPDSYRFQFSPLRRDIGMEYPRAVINTPYGIFWLNSDRVVRRLFGGQIEEVGQAIHPTLRDELVNPAVATFGYDNAHQRLSLYYTVDSNYPQRAFSLNIPSKTWTPQRFAHAIVIAGEADTQTGSATTWDGLVGALGVQARTYAETAGLAGSEGETLFSSNGTAYAYSSTASLDDATVVSAQWVSGGLFSNDPMTVKLVDEVRLNLHAGSASSLSLGVSGNLGNTLTDRETVVPVQSYSSQIRANYDVSGIDFAVRLQSDETGWEVSRVFVRAKPIGQANY